MRIRQPVSETYAQETNWQHRMDMDMTRKGRPKRKRETERYLRELDDVYLQGAKIDA